MDLDEILKLAENFNGHPELKAAFISAMMLRKDWTPAQHQEEFNAQRASWVRGEMGIGLDAKEAAYRKALRDER